MCTAVTGAVEGNPMILLSKLKKRREQLNQWECERILNGIHGATARTMHQIAKEVNRDTVQQLLPPRWKEIELNILDRVWAARFWIELNIQLMR